MQSLVAIAALAWIGALFSPLLGIVSERVGIRTLLCAARAAYALLAGVLAALTLTGALVPWHAFAVAGMAGLLKPSDMAMRDVLVARTMRPEALIGALGISRTTTDSARIVGALAGTAGVALVGMGTAYVVVTAMYLAAFLLSLGVAAPAPARRHADTIASLVQAARYVGTKGDLLGAFGMAFLVNLLAFPFFLGLLPYIAKDVYDVGQAGLGILATAFWSGALSGSLAIGANRLRLRAARVMLWTALAWFLTILAFGQIRSMGPGLLLLFASGLAQSFCLTPLAAVMLRGSSDEMRGPVMGIRMLAIWGLPLGSSPPGRSSSISASRLAR